MLITSRPFAVACAMAILSAAGASAQVNATGWPTSYLSVSTGWTGFFPANTGYGAGSPASGSSGTMFYGIDFTAGPTFGTLQSVTVNINELRASYNPFGTSSAVTHSGVLEFTPVVNCAYTISGNVPMQFTGTFSAAGANASMSLFQVSGPTFASYGNVLFGAPNSSGVLFNGNAPIAGSQTGFLSAGTTYRWTWSFSVSSTNGTDTSAIANVQAIDGGSPYIGISFAVPAPSSAGVCALGLMCAARRRRA